MRVVCVWHVCGNVYRLTVGSVPFCDLCVAERDEASVETPDHNSTSLTEVDKRVKRRLLMGKNPVTLKTACTPRDMHNTGKLCRLPHTEALQPIPLNRSFT